MPPQEMGHVKNGRSPSGAAIDHVECRRQEAVQIDYGPCEAIKPECLGAAGVAGMKYFAWHEAKDVRLKADRDVGFEDIVFHIERGDLLDVLDHANPERYFASGSSWSDATITCTSLRGTRLLQHC